MKIKERGESFYQPMMPGLVEELKDKGSKSPMIIIHVCIPFGLLGIAVAEDGRTVLFVPADTVLLTIAKSDGGFTYNVGYGGVKTARSRRKGRLAHLRR